MVTGDDLERMRLRARMNRRQFCRYFQIPYRTVQDWELKNAKVPEYLFLLMMYKLKNEGYLPEDYA